MMNDGDDGDDGQISRARGCWFFHSCGSPGFFRSKIPKPGGGTTFVGSEPWRDAPYFEETKSCLVETPGGKGAR